MASEFTEHIQLVVIQNEVLQFALSILFIYSHDAMMASYYALDLSISWTDCLAISICSACAN
jgi:hypothetical protein